MNEPDVTCGGPPSGAGLLAAGLQAVAAAARAPPRPPTPAPLERAASSRAAAVVVAAVCGPGTAAQPAVAPSRAAHASMAADRARVLITCLAPVLIGIPPAAG